MEIDEQTLKSAIESFERVEDITDIILLGDDGGVRRVIVKWKIGNVEIANTQKQQKIIYYMLGVSVGSIWKR